MTQYVRLQDLVGRRVLTADGAVAGRIEEIRATWRGEKCLIEEYHLGAAALLERLGLSAARLIGWTVSRDPLRVPWQQLDLSDPEHPRLRCSVEELK